MASIKTSRGRYRYHKKYLYVGLKKMDRDLAYDNLKEIVPILEKNGIQSGPIYGTLLGLIREGNFIEWDEDIDFYLLKEQEELFRTALWELREHGFELVRYDQRGLYSVMKKGEYIDFYVLRRISPDLRHMGGPDFVFEKYLKNTQEYDFKGLKLRIPQDYEEYLEFTYGDWRTPRRYTDYKPSRIKIIKMIVKDFLKNHLPKPIHFYLLKKVHAKHLEAFKQKCKAKSIPIDESIKL